MVLRWGQAPLQVVLQPKLLLYGAGCAALALAIAREPRATASPPAQPCHGSCTRMMRCDTIFFHVLPHGCGGATVTTKHFPYASLLALQAHLPLFWGEMYTQTGLPECREML